jgi:hypothetical protein
MLRNRTHGLPRLLVLVLISVPIVGWCTSGEQLLKELREQVDLQRRQMSQQDLQAFGDGIGRDPAHPDNVVECAPDAIAAFRANDASQPQNKGEYLYNATYAPIDIPIAGDKYCVYLTRPVARGLTVEEARDLYVAYHLEFPRYEPAPADRQIGEDQFLALRAKARAKRASMTQDQRAAIEAQLDDVVECSDKELTAGGFWREVAGGGINEDINSINYVWNWGHSVDGDPCVYVRSPIHRALTVDEARDLLTLTHEPPPPLEHVAPISPAGAERKSGVRTLGVLTTLNVSASN